MNPYCAARKGSRPWGWTNDYGGISNRNKDYGPFSLFIQETEPMRFIFTVLKADIEEARLKWRAADNDIQAILWGNSQERIDAKNNLMNLNQREFPSGNASIEVEEWYKAGEQLEKAIRDYHIYGSIARFEDVRDFIWWRIRKRKYPTSWRVQESVFYTQVHRTEEHYAMIRERSLVDTQDSVFQEWLLDNPVHGPPPYRSLESNGITISWNIIPPHGYRKLHKTGNFIDEEKRTHEFTRRHPDDGPYGIFIQSTEAVATRCPPDIQFRLQPFWDRAGPILDIILWDRARRDSARDELTKINISIEEISASGLIEVSNWINAGVQLDKAIIDFHLHHAVCRFEDVRDFIWERISRRCYPAGWRVKKKDFVKQIEKTKAELAEIWGSVGSDSEDAIHCDRQEDLSPYPSHNEPSSPTPESEFISKRANSIQSKRGRQNGTGQRATGERNRIQKRKLRPRRQRGQGN